MPSSLGALDDGGVLLYGTFADGNRASASRRGRLPAATRRTAGRACAGCVVAYEDGFLGGPPPRFVQRIAAVRRRLLRRGRLRRCRPARRLKSADSNPRHEPHRCSIVAWSRRCTRTAASTTTLRRLIDWHIAEGTGCIGVVGTTGESPTVDGEHCGSSASPSSMPQAACPSWPAPAPIPAEAIELTRFAKRWRRLHLSVVPYYNKPSQEGIYQPLQGHRRAVDLPWCSTTCPAARSPTCSRHRAAPGPGARHRDRHQGRHRRHRARRVADQKAPKGASIRRRQHRRGLMLLGGQGNVSVTANVARG